jgi:prepilin-type N-terminal cleavage/methylation domain-containing protein
MLNKRKSVARNRKGFTLIELLVAISILAVGLLAAVTMQETALDKNNIAIRNTMATTVAQMVMDDLLSVNILPNNYWWSQFYGPPANPYGGTAADTAATLYPYNRFPPYDGVTVTTAQPNYLDSSGTYSAEYFLTPNTPTTNITQIQVVVFRNGVQVPFSYFSYRAVPSL